METYGCVRKTATLFRIPGFCARSLLILSVPLSDSLSRQGDFVFGEWRIADRHKAGLYDRMDFYLDTNTKNHPAMVSGAGFRGGLKQLTSRPFRLVPYFDPGVWGGQWMKEVCHLDPAEKNYAWAFDGVPEENSLYLNYGGVRIESPAMNLTLYQPREFLGQKNFARFGAEFPIRFDFLIPAGTIHCSSKNCMVLEVSATPYIFTFKLWDWDRVGLDGKPRPIHIEDGKKVLQFDRTTPWVRENLINRFKTMEETPDYTRVKTGLHELEFIETQVYSIQTQVRIPSDGEGTVCNLVEGKGAVVESPEGRVPPFPVHYAETLLLPTKAGDFVIRTREPGSPIKVLKANVRH